MRKRFLISFQKASGLVSLRSKKRLEELAATFLGPYGDFVRGIRLSAAVREERPTRSGTGRSANIPRFDKKVRNSGLPYIRKNPLPTIRTYHVVFYGSGYSYI